jgi:hypothetical protein
MLNKFLHRMLDIFDHTIDIDYNQSKEIKEDYIFYCFLIFFLVQIPITIIYLSLPYFIFSYLVGGFPLTIFNFCITNFFGFFMNCRLLYELGIFKLFGYLFERLRQHLLNLKYR